MTAENKTGGGGVPGSTKAEIPKRLKGKPKVLLPLGILRGNHLGCLTSVQDGSKIFCQRKDQKQALWSVSVYCGIDSDNLHAPCRGHDT